jgi:hypothetical protein
MEVLTTKMSIMFFWLAWATFRRSILTASTLKMEAVYSSETLVSTYKSIRRHKSDDSVSWFLLFVVNFCSTFRNSFLWIHVVRFVQYRIRFCSCNQVSYGCNKYEQNSLNLSFTPEKTAVSQIPAAGQTADLCTQSVTRCMWDRWQSTVEQPSGQPSEKPATWLPRHLWGELFVVVPMHQRTSQTDGNIQFPSVSSPLSLAFLIRIFSMQVHGVTQIRH